MKGIITHLPHRGLVVAVYMYIKSYMALYVHTAASLKYMYNIIPTHSFLSMTSHGSSPLCL